MTLISNKHVSKSLSNEARARIEAKIVILERWAREGIPYLRTPEGHYVEENNQRLLDKYPNVKPHQFYTWDGSENCLYTLNSSLLTAAEQEMYGVLGFVKTPRQTVLKHSDLVERMEDLLGTKGRPGLLQQRAEAQLSEGSAELAVIKTELAILKMRVVNTAREFIRFRTEIIDLENELNKSERTKSGLIKLGQRQLKEKDDHIDLLNDEVAHLRQQIARLKGKGSSLEVVE